MRGLKKENRNVVLMLVLTAFVMTIIPEMAMAQNVNNILNNGYFKTAINFGLGMYAAWKWFEYFNGFSPNSAFKDIIVPAIITFLAFQWQTVLGWFSITQR